MDTELLLLGFIVLHMILDGAGVCARFVSFILFVVREASVDGLFSFSFFFSFIQASLGVRAGARKEISTIAMRKVNVCAPF